MEIDGPLQDATFLERPNRFLTVIDMDGKRIESHLPDPGRLKELLIPGAKLKVRRAPLSETHRKTKWTTVLVKTESHWVSLDSTLPNRFVEELLLKGELPFFSDSKMLRREVRQNHHRFDFLIVKDGHPFYLEVKSVTLVVDGVAMFPDAVTERGTRHLNAMSRLVRSGKEAGVLFVCQRPDVKLFKPQWDKDPRFAQALEHGANNGVKIWVISCDVSPLFIKFKEEVPYDLTPF